MKLKLKLKLLSELKSFQSKTTKQPETRPLKKLRKMQKRKIHWNCSILYFKFVRTVYNYSGNMIYRFLIVINLILKVKSPPKSINI